MGQKIKHHHSRKPKGARSAVVLDMILNTKGGPMRDRRERRMKDARNQWDRDWEEDDSESER